jgi:hypothetical protein
MAFNSVIKMDPQGGWYIELTDEIEDITVRCKDLEEYMDKIEEMGSQYGPGVEVKWSSDENLHPAYLDEIRSKMAEYQREVNEKEGE